MSALAPHIEAASQACVLVRVYEAHALDDPQNNSVLSFGSPSVLKPC